MASTSPLKKKLQKRPVSSRGQTTSSKKSRRELYLSENDVFDILSDSGSDCEYVVDKKGDLDQNDENVDFVAIRSLTRKLRNYDVDDVDKQVPVLQNAGTSRARGGGSKGGISKTAALLDEKFSWSKDFSTFTGEKETYLRDPGPISGFQDPTDIFCNIWDRKFMEMVVRETNTYAFDILIQYSDPDKGGTIPDHLGVWTEVTVEELYRYFAMLILFSFCYRSRLQDYWSTGILGMPDLRSVMGRNRFTSINRFLHFVSNADLTTRGHDRKIRKIAPVVDHCNRKFAGIYTPLQHLSLDESLLLWKGALSWKQCIRTKAARFGIKSFELCEAKTGYLLQYRIYTGKNIEMVPESLHGFRDHSSKIVLELMEKYLDVGHVLVMDNWYNQLSLTRFLKSRRTDVLGTLNRRRNGIPPAIKDLDPNDLDRGAVVSGHSGDIALVAWKDVRLVTLMSTYHKHLMIPQKRSGQIILKPVAVKEYNDYMGGVDLKDQKLSMFIMERKRNIKWYMKVFRRLLNTSLLNAYIIYTKHPTYHVLSHRNFRLKVVEGLLSRYPSQTSVPVRVSSTPQKPRVHLPIRLGSGKHYPVFTDFVSKTEKGRRRQLRCVRCSALKLRTSVTTMCELCGVALCIGKCWKEYHNIDNLNEEIKDDPPLPLT